MNNEWLQRKSWRDNKIKSGAQYSVYVLIGFTLFWNGISLPIFWSSWPQLITDFREMPEKAFILIFPLIGLILIYVSYASIQNWRRFGATPLVLDPFPGSIGGHVGGTIETNIPFDPNQHFEITLSNIYSYVSGTGKNRSRKEDVKWQSEGYCALSPAGSSTHGHKGTRIQFRFDVPTGLRPSDLKKRGTYYFWRVRITSKMDGPDFDRSFEIPVFPTSEKSQNIQYDSVEHPATQEAAQSGLETIAQITSLGNGIEVYFPPGKRPSMGISSIVFGLVFGGSGIGAGYLGAPLLFPIVFGMIGFLIIAFGIYYLTKSLRVRATAEGIDRIRYCMGSALSRSHIPITEIKDLQIGHGGSTQSGKSNTVYYELNVITKENKEVVIGERTTKRAEAELLRDTYLMYLGKFVS